MGSVDRLAGAAGSIGITTKTTAGQLITPVSAPVVRWYTDTARTLGEAVLTVTGAGSSYTASWTAAQAPAAAAARYLKVTIEVSAGVFDVDVDDEVRFVDAGSEIDVGYFSVLEGRGADPSFSDPPYSDEDIRQARREVEEAIEAAVAQALGKGVSFIPRTRQITINGSGDDSIDLPDYFVRSVFSASIGGVPLTSAQLADLIAASGQLSSTLLTWTRGMRNVVVAYEHGMDAPPAIIRRAALLLLKAWLPAFKASGSDPGARGIRSLSAEGISMSFMDAEGDSTGVADVDRLIKSWLASPDLASVPV